MLELFFLILLLFLQPRCFGNFHTSSIKLCDSTWFVYNKKRWISCKIQPIQICQKEKNIFCWHMILNYHEKKISLFLLMKICIGTSLTLILLLFSFFCQIFPYNTTMLHGLHVPKRLFSRNFYFHTLIINVGKTCTIQSRCWKIKLCTKLLFMNQTFFYFAIKVKTIF